MFSVTNLHYDLAERPRGFAYGGIGAMHLLAQRTGLIGHNMFRCSMFFNGTFQNIIDPSGIGSFQWSHRYDLTGEVVNHHKDVDGPQSPT